MGAGSSLDNSMRFHGGVADTGWVLIELHGELANGGFGHGSLRVWTEEGELIATGSQTASMRFLFDEGEMPNLPQPPAPEARPGLERAPCSTRSCSSPSPSPARSTPRSSRWTTTSWSRRHVRGTAAGPPPGPGAEDRRQPTGATRCGSSTASSTRRSA